MSTWADWSDARRADPLRLYAGLLSPASPQFKTHFGLNPFTGNERTTKHDITSRMPIDSGVVEVYQSQDVFEHIEYERLVAVLNEIHRVLKVGGRLRLSLPDYRFPHYRNRTLKDDLGSFVFDPLGGGELVDGRVIKGGHLWFPTYESVRFLLDRSAFQHRGRIEFLHFYDEHSNPILHHIDYSIGYIQRTPDHDNRASNPRLPMSIVVDAFKLC